MSERKTLTVGNRPWTIKNVVAVAEGRASIAFRPSAFIRRQIRAGVNYVERLWKDGHQVYGVTTGYGASVDRKVPQRLVKELSRQLVRYHGCGMGAYFDEEQTRAILVVRLISLATGFSGVREILLERLAVMVNEGILPLIPEEGSVGASGDLTPLSYIAAVLMGEGQVRFKQEKCSAKEAWEHLGLKPFELNPKEGLALMNGTSVMTALAILAFTRASYLEQLACRITALSSLTLKGNPTHFDRRLFELKNHPGSSQVAEWIRLDLNGHSQTQKSKLMAARLQDTYALRCAPHVIGVMSDALPWMKRQLEIELNSANDNPLVDGIKKQVMHGGHFYGGHVAFAMDSLKNVVANIADLLDRQMALLVDIRTNHGLPPNLSGASNKRMAINHGFKAVQIGASAWTAEALKLTMPASVFSRSTECHNQDKVSLGTIAARDALRVLQLTEQVAAAVLLGALQGLEWQLRHKKLDRKIISRALQDQLYTVRKQVQYLEEDRPLESDLRWTVEQIRKRSWPLYGMKSSENQSPTAFT